MAAGYFIHGNLTWTVALDEFELIVRVYCPWRVILICGPMNPVKRSSMISAWWVIAMIQGVVQQSIMRAIIAVSIGPARTATSFRMQRQFIESRGQCYTRLRFINCLTM